MAAAFSGLEKITIAKPLAFLKGHQVGVILALKGHRKGIDLYTFALRGILLRFLDFSNHPRVHIFLQFLKQKARSLSMRALSTIPALFFLLLKLP